MPDVTSKGPQPPVSDLLHWPPRRRPTRREGTIAALVSAPLLAIALGAAFAPKLDAHEPMQPIPHEKMQIVLNQMPDTPLPSASGGRMQVLAPDMTAPTVAAPPRAVRVAVAQPARAADLEARDASADEDWGDRTLLHDDDEDADQPRDRRYHHDRPLEPLEDEETAGPPN